MTTELFEFRGHTRIKQIKHLLATGQIDDQFFWVRRTGARPSVRSTATRAMKLTPAGSTARS